MGTHSGGGGGGGKSYYKTQGGSLRCVALLWHHPGEGIRGYNQPGRQNKAHSWKLKSTTFVFLTKLRLSLVVSLCYPHPIGTTRSTHTPLPTIPASPAGFVHVTTPPRGVIINVAAAQLLASC